MTDDEIRKSMDYIYGYFCGRAALSLPGASDAWLMGCEDAEGDMMHGAESFVYASAEKFASLDEDGLVVGSITPRRGLTLYFRIDDVNDPVPMTIWIWDAEKYRSSNGSRGWQLFSSTAILDP